MKARLEPKGERASQGDGGPKRERWEAQRDGGIKEKFHPLKEEIIREGGVCL